MICSTKVVLTSKNTNTLLRISYVRSAYIRRNTVAGCFILLLSWMSYFSLKSPKFSHFSLKLSEDALLSISACVFAWALQKMEPDYSIAPGYGCWFSSQKLQMHFYCSQNTLSNWVYHRIHTSWHNHTLQSLDRSCYSCQQICRRHKWLDGQHSW